MESHRLAFSGEMTIYQAADQKAALMNAIADTETLELDLTQVSEMDSAGLQLLILFKRETQRQGKAGHIVGHSAAVQELIDFVNLAAWLGDPMVIPPGSTPGKDGAQ